MVAAIPTIQVLLDDGSGTYPTDITSRVKLDGITISGHGRTDEFATAPATSFTCTLKNDDGGLSAGAISPGQGIRYKETKGATTVNAFTGRISELPLGWTGGPAKASQVTLTAVDPLTALSLQPLRSMLEQEILLLSPSAYYTLGEAAGSTSAGDTSGGQSAPLTIAGDLPALTFGSGTGPADGLSATQFFAGQYLSSPSTGTASSATTFTIGCAFATTSAGTGVGIVSSNGWAIQLGIPSGHLSAIGPGFSFNDSSSTASNDGLTHVAILTGNGVTATLYIDGVAAGTAAIGASTNDQHTQAGSSVYAGTLSHLFTLPTTITAAQALLISQVALGTLSETTAARFARIAGYAGVSSTSTPSNSGVLMASQAISGSSALDGLQAVTAAEGGVMFANGTGTLVMQGHGYRAAKTTATLTVPLKDLVASSVLLTWDVQQVVNKVTATRAGGAQQTVLDSASIATYGTLPMSLDLGLAADSDVLSAAQWLVNKHLAPVKRMPSATVNLLTSTIAEQLIATEIGDRWALSGLPSQAWTGFGDLTVEGWSKTLTVSETGAEWSMTVNLLPFTLSQSGIYDNAGSLYDAAVYA